MWKHRAYTWLGLAATLALPSCHTASSEEAAKPELQQVIGESMKELYMASSAAAPQSAGQQKLVLQMAEKASNGKELLLAMRAAVGVFPAGQSMESRVRATVAAKMMHVATLNQMIEYAMHYAVNREDGRPFAQRMFQLAERSRDAQTWYRIELAVRHLKVDDLEREAQGKGNQLAGVR